MTINYHYYVYSGNKSNNTILSLRENVYGSVNMKCCNCNDFFSSSLRNITPNDCSSLTPLHVTTKQHYNIMDQNNLLKSIYFER